MIKNDNSFRPDFYLVKMSMIEDVGIFYNSQNGDVNHYKIYKNKHNKEYIRYSFYSQGLSFTRFLL
jgi:hypothetical protein